MPRAIWTGSITFGLVNIPVRIYSAVHEHKLRFHLRHEPDGGPIGYEKVCKLEGKEGPGDEIVKVYEYEKGEYVEMTDVDFDAVQVEGTRTIDLESFVAYDEIDPSFFAHTYLVGPQEGAEKPYALLVRAMTESELVAIGKFVMRSRQYLGALRIRSGVLTLEQMYFHDEVDPPDTVIPEELPKVASRELEMARQLIDNYSEPWDPTAYGDSYHDAICKLIKQKIEGHDVHETVEPPEEPEQTTDLMAALRESMKRAKTGRRSGAGGNGRRASSGGRDDLASLSKAELDKRAREADIQGRSKMTKQELVEALS